MGAGAIFALAAPPASLVPALWIGMALLAWSLFASETTRRVAGIGRGLAFGFGANAVALSFVPEVVARFTPLGRAPGWLALVLLAGFEGLRWATAGFVCRAAMRVGVRREWAFAIGVYVGTFVPTIFPWSAAGGATPWPIMVQLADTIGERGVTFTMALAAGLLADGARRAWEYRAARGRALRAAGAPVVAAVAVIALVAIAGAAKMKQADAAREAAARVRVALVQPSIGATDRWEPENAPGILAKLSALTKTAEARGAQLVVWPEAAYPYPTAHASRRAPVGRFAILQPGVRGPVLTGILLRGGPDESYNAAVVATPDGALDGPQDKVHLLWFGETVPLADRWAWIKKTFARGTGLTPGTRMVALHAGAVRAAVLNCFEDTLPEAGREAATVAPNLLVNVTNDAWFLDAMPSGAGRIESRESELHLRLAVLRAVELRKDLVRAVNEGETTFVDAAGRVRARYDDAMPAPLVVDAALLDGAPTLYARFGDLPMVLAIFLFAAARVVRTRRVLKI